MTALFRSSALALLFVPGAALAQFSETVTPPPSVSSPSVQVPIGSGPSPIGASLPELSPQTIAADVVRTRLNSRTTFAAPDFDPFEVESDVAGRAHLHAGEGLRVAGVDMDGLPLGEGAMLDVTMVYAMESRDPYDVRGYQSAGYLNGAPARVVRYDPRLLECSTRVSEAGDYPDTYYRGDSHGTVIGIHTRYPRYRHHRDFGFGIEARRPYWDVRYGYDYGYGRGYDGRGYSNGYGSGYGYNPYVGGGYRPYLERRRLRDVRRARDNARDRNGRSGNGGVVIDPAPRQTRRSPGNTRTGLGVGRVGGVLPDEPRRDPVARTGRSTQTGRSGQINRNGQLRRGGEDPTRTTRERIPGTVSTTPRRATRTPNSRDGARRAPREGIRSEPSISQPVSRGQTTRPSSNRAQPKRRSDYGRPNRRIAEPDSAKRSQSRSTPKSRPTPKSVDRATDRSFSKPSRSQSSPKSSKSSSSRSSSKSNRSAPLRSSSRPKARSDARPQLNWQAGYIERPAGLCAKEETLSLFIPIDRLEAARFDGLTVMVQDRFGRELPVFVPPNYVEGFLIAASQG